MKYDRRTFIKTIGAIAGFGAAKSILGYTPTAQATQAKLGNGTWGAYVPSALQADVMKNGGNSKLSSYLMQLEGAAQQMASSEAFRDIKFYGAKIGHNQLTDQQKKDKKSIVPFMFLSKNAFYDAEFIQASYGSVSVPGAKLGKGKTPDSSINKKVHKFMKDGKYTAISGKNPNFYSKDDQLGCRITTHNFFGKNKADDQEAYIKAHGLPENQFVNDQFTLIDVLTTYLSSLNDTIGVSREDDKENGRITDAYQAVAEMDIHNNGKVIKMPIFDTRFILDGVKSVEFALRAKAGDKVNFMKELPDMINAIIITPGAYTHTETSYDRDNAWAGSETSPLERMNIPVGSVFEKSVAGWGDSGDVLDTVISVGYLPEKPINKGLKVPGGADANAGHGPGDGPGPGPGNGGGMGSTSGGDGIGGGTGGSTGGGTGPGGNGTR